MKETERNISQYIPLVINGETHVFFMTNDFSLIANKLIMLGCRIPDKTDFFIDKNLYKNVKSKMLRLCKETKSESLFSFTVSYGIDLSELTIYLKEFDEFFTVLLKDLTPSGETTTLDKLFSYIAENKTDEIEKLAKSGFDFEQIIQQGATPLMGAAIINAFDSVKTLLKLGANINAKDINGQTPLMRAITRKSTETIDILLADKNIDLEIKDINGNTALINAAIHNNIEAVKKLIEADANLNATNKLDKTALHISIELHHNKISELLIDSGANLELIDKTFRTPLLLAVWNDNIQIAKKLINAHAHIDIEEKYLNGELIIASINESTRFLEYYLNKYDIPSLALSIAFIKAIEFSAINSIITILEQSDKKAEFATCLLFSVCEDNKAELFSLCLKYEGDVNSIGSFGMTPLMICSFSFSGTESLVRQLLENGADPDITDYFGMTALMYAASKSNAIIIQILLENGADPSIQDNEGNTYEYYLNELDYRTYDELNRERLKKTISEIKSENEVLVEEELEDEISDDCQTFNECFWYYRNRFFKLNPEAKNKDSVIYNAANISRTTYGKIKNDPKYNISKGMIQALAFGLQLSVDATEHLMQSAGYTFTKNDKIDTEIKCLLAAKKYHWKYWTEEMADKLGTHPRK